MGDCVAMKKHEKPTRAPGCCCCMWALNHAATFVVRSVLPKPGGPFKTDALPAIMFACNWRSTLLKFMYAPFSLVSGVAAVAAYDLPRPTFLSGGHPQRQRHREGAVTAAVTAPLALSPRRTPSVVQIVLGDGGFLL